MAARRICSLFLSLPPGAFTHPWLNHMHDIAAARNAGMRVVAVPYGYNHGEDIADSDPDAVIESLTELAGLIELWNTFR